MIDEFLLFTNELFSLVCLRWGRLRSFVRVGSYTTPRFAIAIPGLIPRAVVLVWQVAVYATIPVCPRNGPVIVVLVPRADRHVGLAAKPIWAVFDIVVTLEIDKAAKLVQLVQV